MNPSTTKKHHFILIGIVVILIVVNIAGFWFFWYPHFPPNTFGGKVVELSDHSIVIMNAHGRRSTFSIASSTQIVTGRNVTPETEVTVDTFVMIVVMSPEPNATATKIRILSTDAFARVGNSSTP